MEKDYKKLYEDSLARTQRAFNTNRCTIGFMNEIFPETKESEDEKVRKFLVKWVNEIMPVKPYDNDGFDKEKVLAWIEKQGEKDEEILVLKDQIESLHAAIKAIKETHRIELD